VADDVVDLVARRWERRTEPNEHEPIEALRAAVRAIEAGEIDPDHIVVCYHVPEDPPRTGWFQAGLQSELGAEGLVHRIAHMMAQTEVG
jgi:hypothetical protein